MIRLLFCCIFLATLTGCASAPASRHVQFGDEITSLMRRMDRLVYERELTEQQIEIQRREDAASLAESTRHLADALASRGRDKDFGLFVTALRGHADRIEQRAGGDIPGTLWDSFTEIRQTCNACHESFRQ